MRYILKTEINTTGNKIFSKKRQGKSFVYLVKDELGNTQTVDKTWIVNNASFIVNLGISGENLYPKEIKKSKPASVRVERVKSYELNPLEFELFKIARTYSVSPTELFNTLNNASYYLNNRLTIMIPAFYNGLVDNIFLLNEYYVNYVSGKCNVIKRNFNSEELKKIEGVIAFSYAGIEENIFDEIVEKIEKLSDSEALQKLKESTSVKALEAKVWTTLSEEKAIFTTLPEGYFATGISAEVDKMLYMGKHILFGLKLDYASLQFCRKHFNLEALNSKLSGLIADKIIKINLKNGVYDDVLKNTKIKVSH